MAHPVVVNSQAGITQDYVLYLAADSPAVTALTFVLWPKYECKEGAGWLATVTRLSAAGTAATVAFVHARTRDGRPYEDSLLPWTQLAQHD